ncbi:MAG: hypothetical protein ACJAUP_002333 [Cellvibrionaceae bacterium]
MYLYQQYFPYVLNLEYKGIIVMKALYERHFRVNAGLSKATLQSKLALNK